MRIGLQLPSYEDRLLDIIHANLFLSSFLLRMLRKVKLIPRDLGTCNS